MSLKLNPAALKHAKTTIKYNEVEFDLANGTVSFRRNGLLVATFKPEYVLGPRDVLHVTGIKGSVDVVTT